MSTLKIESKKEFLNRLRSYKIFIDNELVGKVQNGKIQNFELEPGNHKVYAKLDFFKSKEIGIQINENEVTEIKLKGSEFMLASYLVFLLILLFLTITKLFMKIDFDYKLLVSVLLFLLISKDAILKIQEVKK